MKNAPTVFSDESALDKHDYTCGTLPHRVNTVVADTLALLIEGRAITGMEAVFEQSTTRLAAYVYYLKSAYGWPVKCSSFVVGTKDGRVVEVARYWLPIAVREAALNAGARAWIELVKEASFSRRKQVRQCRATATAKNAARKLMRKADPRQGDLWGPA